MSPTYRDILPPPALGNPNTSAAFTTATSITTTSTATPIKLASSVRARCNLIGKMINDVSTAMRAASVEAKTTHTVTAQTPKESAAPNNSIVVVAAAASDFHDDNNTSTTTTPIDAGNMINKQRFPAEEELLSRATQEHKSKLTTTTPKADPLPKSYTKPHETQQVAASSAKSEPSENKCASKELTTLSYQREVELNRTFSQLEQQLKIYSNRTQSKGLAEQQPKPSFAERNQQLKANFLADTCERNKAEQKQPEQRGLTQSTTSLGCRERATCGPCRKAPPHLRLRIPATSTETRLEQKADVLEAVLEPTKLSLVARRKLELTRRFEPQQQQQQQLKNSRSSPTTTTTCPAHFPSVQQLRLRFDRQSNNTDKMIVQPNKLSDTASPESSSGHLLALKSKALEQRQSPLSDEGCNLGQSPYSSDEDNDNVSIRTASTTVERKRKDKVARSASSDSALGLEVDEALLDTAATATEQAVPHDKQRRMTLTVTDLPLRPALLPLAEPTALPDSPTSESPANLLSQATVPSKVLLEERVVEIPEDPRSAGSLSSSRRESAQSCLSDYPISECGGVRFVRTPSVVVSDYSDDIMCGITLEEIEYFRAQRLRRRRSSLDTTSGTEKDGADGGVHSDVSASSSCSNLYYCGSTISALDGAECYVNGMRMPLAAERKASACSTCSASGGEEDDAVFSIPEQPEEVEGQLGKDLAELLAAQQLNTKRPKKVGMCEQCSGAATVGVERC